ncbi:MAG: hypothetical protein ABJA67_00630 [Chthonomonadales bacterium]
MVRRYMHKSLLAIAIAVLCSLTVIHASAQVAGNNPLITVDENGNGSIQFSGSPPTNMPGVLLADPGPGGLGSALTYNLLGPPSLVAGDLVMTEPSDGSITDLIRFNPSGTGGQNFSSLVFYSDNADGVDSLADKGFPQSRYTNVVFVTETGPEAGPNGFVYTPTANQPGFVAGFNVTYNIISDPGVSVPEPGSVTLLLGLAVPGTALAFRRLRRRTK